MNGGYVMVDFAPLMINAMSAEQTVPDIYARVMDAMSSGKPIIAYNCTVVGGSVVSPVCIYAYTQSSTIICAIPGTTHYMAITSPDKVSIR